MNDSFFDPFWNLDQIRAWACSRDPEVVRLATERSHRSRSALAIAVRSAQATLKAKQAGRDVTAELWRASGWPPPQSGHVSPTAVERLASNLGVPISWILSDAGLDVQYPRCEPTQALLEACARAGEADREVVLSLFRGAHPKDVTSWMDDPAVPLLSPELRRRLVDFVYREEVQGPWRWTRHPEFPIDDYMLVLFRTGRLTAYANLPNNPVARLLTKADWGGLEIAIGGELERTSVWRIGRRTKSGAGSFESVRVERAAVLREFPEEPPTARILATPPTDDSARAVIRRALVESGGFVSQKNGAEIVRTRMPTFPKKRAMQLVKELTRNEKPGPKGPRKNRAANRAD
jgi:hypothetical protein